MLLLHEQELDAGVCFQDFSQKGVKENSNLQVFHMPVDLLGFLAILNIFLIVISDETLCKY